MAIPDKTVDAGMNASSTGRRQAGSKTLLPLWIAAISLAVIAVTLIVGFITVGQALQDAQGSVRQLQQQVTQLQKGLSGLIG